MLQLLTNVEWALIGFVTTVVVPLAVTYGANKVITDTFKEKFITNKQELEKLELEEKDKFNQYDKDCKDCKRCIEEEISKVESIVNTFINNTCHERMRVLMESVQNYLLDSNKLPKFALASSCDKRQEEYSRSFQEIKDKIEKRDKQIFDILSQILIKVS